MEVKEEKHIYRNHFIGRNKNVNCLPLLSGRLGGRSAGA